MQVWLPALKLTSQQSQVFHPRAPSPAKPFPLVTCLPAVPTHTLLGTDPGTEAVNLVFLVGIQTLSGQCLKPHLFLLKVARE